MASLGQELRIKREERGASLKDVADQTKINLRLLQALEDDCYDRLPEPFFLKGVLRSYVRAIGADEGHFLQRLAEATKIVPDPAAVDAVPKHRARRKVPVKAAIIIFVLMAAAVIIYFATAARRGPAPAPQSSRTEAPAIRLPEPPPSAVTKTAAAVVPEAPLRLEMIFQAETWMLITADGAKVFEGVQTPGGTAEFKAQREILLQIGNAGGFTFKLNGKPGKSMGPAGAVRTDVRITPQTLAEFTGDTAAVSPLR
jgi:cytoskeleton protein RodZ